MKKLLVANWKMNTTLPQGQALAQRLVAAYDAHTDTPLPTMVIMPPFTHLSALAAVIQIQPNLRLGAQCCDAHPQGAYTGAVSADMLAALGVAYVLVGHSERRTHYQEQTPTLVAQVRMALRVGIQPIFCCGEPVVARQNNKEKAFVTQQLQPLLGLPQADVAQLLIAYEPIWAIGTGEVATPAQVEEMHQHIYQLIIQQHGHVVASEILLLYGGSVKPDNAAALFACAHVNGALVGGASLDDVAMLDMAQSLAASG